MPGPTQLTEGPLFDVTGALRANPPDSAPAPPGVLLAVSGGAQWVYVAAGEAIRADDSPGGHGTPMTWPVRTDAGSVTKMVATTAAVMRLVDAGEVNLDDPAQRYVRRLNGQAYTVRDLLEHRAGLWEWWPVYLSGARGPDALQLAADLPLRYAPGAARHYSDLGFMLLGELVSAVTGAALGDAVDELVLGPFGLVETRYAQPEPGAPVAASSTGDVVERLMIETGEPYPVTGKVDDFDRWRGYPLVGEVNDGNAFHAFGGTAGHAGLFTTAADLLRFAEGLLASLNGAGPITAQTAGQFVSAGRDPAQALGFRRWPGSSGVAVGHTGFPGVAFGLLPESRAAVVMITNRLHVPGTTFRSTDAMWQLVLDAAGSHLSNLRSQA